VRDLTLTAIVGVAYERRSAACGQRDRPRPGGTGDRVTDHRRRDRVLRPVGLSHALIAAAVGFELLIKVGYEVVAGGPAFPMDQGEGVRQLPIAHAAGVAVGAVFALCSSSSRMIRSLPRTRANPRRSTRSYDSCAVMR
jgi:hypothetical protein